jgi:hypothetical protein
MTIAPGAAPSSLRLLSRPLLAARVVRRYRRTYGRIPVLFPPTKYSEKITFRKLFDRRPYLTLTSDKYAVREYARAILGEDLAPELYYRTTDPRTIPFASLPRRFAVKATHGSGWNVIVRDARAQDQRTLIATCERWMRSNYARRRDEWAYEDIPPQIIVEELLDDGSGRSPQDIKVLVFNQRVRIVQIDEDRFGDHRRMFLDAEWNVLPIFDFVPQIETRPERPSRLDDIIRYAEALGCDTDFLRVDFYQEGNRVRFGEMTHTPGSGLSPIYPTHWDDRWGAWWEMSAVTT